MANFEHITLLRIKPRLSEYILIPVLLVCDCPKARPLTNKVTLAQKCDAVGECYCPDYNGKVTVYVKGSGCVYSGK